MAQFNLGQSNQARATLAEADEIIQRRFPSATQISARDWHDKLAAHVLFSEATALIRPTVVPPSR
jgi:hypothetical protein